MKKYFTFLSLTMVALTTIEAAECPKAGQLKSQPMKSTIEKTDILPLRAVEEKERSFKSNDSHFKAPVVDDTKSHRVIALQVAAGEEKLDAINTVGLDDYKLSRQEFTYTDFGAPAVCLNMRYDRYGELYTVSYFEYEYDNMNRVISAGQFYIEESLWSNNQKYEYFYEGLSDQYSTVISYYGSEPSEKIEYTYDSNGFPIRVLEYYWDDSLEEFSPSDWKEYGYDENGRMNYLRTYYWDFFGNEGWIGQTGESAVYDSEGRYLVYTSYNWVAGTEWENHWRNVYEYTSFGERKSISTEQWNGQDWNGPSVYPNGLIRYNSWTEYYYDEKDRLTLIDYSWGTAEGGKFTDRKEVCEYTTLENGDVQSYSYDLNYAYEGAEPTSNKYGISVYNSDGYILSSLEGWLDEGQEYPSEQWVHERTEHNGLLSTTIYSWVEGKRLNGLKETFSYGDDWDGYPSDYPTEDFLFKGNGTEEEIWLPMNEYYFTYQHEYLTGFMYYLYYDGEKYFVNGMNSAFDFSVSAENIWQWRLTNMGEAYGLYKMLWIDNYGGDGISLEPDPYESDRTTFEYSDVETSSIKDVPSLDTVEIERYDISGLRLTAPVKGINIVRYSDGSTRKVIVK